MKLNLWLIMVFVVTVINYCFKIAHQNDLDKTFLCIGKMSDAQAALKRAIVTLEASMSKEEKFTKVSYYLHVVIV